MKSLSITLCLLFTSMLFAQEAPKTDENKASENPNELKEVTVYDNKKQYLKVESDKTTISVRDNAMLNSGSSLEAVKKIPGVITSPTGTITLNSKGVTIYIDGAPSSLSGNDLQNYLATLPANAIEKVELIYNPGASFDADASGSIIN
ncbi:Plug domain-containing protein, partial [Flavobacterium sp.]|uniref:Plug domain-containing protein n=1 Tax=Flavobacterium sp. TaxID=239 RepID=UPI002FDD2609